MIQKIVNEQPFQVLSNAFSISPSESGYDLQISADGEQYSTLFSVASGVTRQVTNIASGSYFRLLNNTSTVSVNWQRNCSGGGSVDLSDYPTREEVEQEINEALSGATITVDLSGYSTTVEVEGMIASAITSAKTAIEAEIPDVSNFITSADTENFVTSAQVASQVEEYGYITMADIPTDVSAFNNDAGYITSDALPTNVSSLDNDAGYITSGEAQTLIDASLSGVSVDLSGYYTSAQTDTLIANATSGMVTQNYIQQQGYLTSADTGNFVTSADTASIQSQLDDVERVTAIALNDIHNEISDFVTSADVASQVESYHYITSAATANMVTSTSIHSIVALSQAAYNTLVSGGTVDSATFYVITGTTA